MISDEYIRRSACILVWRWEKIFLTWSLVWNMEFVSNLKYLTINNLLLIKISPFHQLFIKNSTHK